MNFIKAQIKDFYLRDSQIENIFINEYLPAAPGDYVKVYLYAYMYAEYGMELDDSVMAQQLGLPQKKILDAWTYWEQMGVIRKHYIDSKGNVDFTVEFLNIKELMYGKSTEPITQSKQEEEEEVFGNQDLKAAFAEMEKVMERSLSTAEVKDIMTWILDEQISTELILYGMRYSLERGKGSMRYISTVIHNWVNEGHTSVEDIHMHLQETDQRHYQYRRVMAALGFHRNPTEEEKKIMDRWFDEQGFNMDRVLEACGKTSGISNPNINYVNKVLLNWKVESEKRGVDANKPIKVTNAQLKKYLEYLRTKVIEDANERREEVYFKIPRIKEIDQQVQELGMELSKALIRGGAGQTEVIRGEMNDLNMERAFLLTENEFEMDYTDVKYRCDICNDTGITDSGERCQCMAQRYEEAEVWLKTQQGMTNGDN